MDNREEGVYISFEPAGELATDIVLTKIERVTGGQKVDSVLLTPTETEKVRLALNARKGE